MLDSEGKEQERNRKVKERRIVRQWFLLGLVCCLLLVLSPGAVWGQSPTPADPADFGITDPSASEAISRRTQDSKTFQLDSLQPDRSRFVTIFQQDLHWMDGTGQWRNVNLQLTDRGGGVFRSDQAFTKVQVDRGRPDLTVTDPNGIGISFILPQSPTIPSQANDRVQHTGPSGIDWTHRLTVWEVKLVSEPIPASRGPVTYRFPFQAVNTSVSLVDGELIGLGFKVRRPVLIGADSTIRSFDWELDGNVLVLSLDDSAFPPEFFPYVVDPSTTFEPDASGDDAYGGFSSTDGIYLPDDTCDANISAGVDETIDDVFMISGKDTSGGEFFNRASFIRWDTSGLSDTATINSADYKPVVQTDALNSDSRNFIGSYYDPANYPLTGCEITAAEMADVGTTAFSTAVSNISGPGGTRNTISLTGLANISLTGDTALVTGISGGEPTGNNRVVVYTFDNGSNFPQLSVEWTDDVTPTVTDFSPDKVGDESSVGVTVTGTDFDTDAELLMEKSGQPDIACTGESTNGAGTEITATCDFTGVSIGLWDARVNNDPGVGSFSDTLVSATRVYERPTITSIDPEDAQNDASLSLQVNGSAFDTVDPAVVTLEKGGESDITCSGGTSSATILTRDCAITGVAVGDWSVTVENGTVLSDTLVDGLNLWSSLGSPNPQNLSPTVASDQTSDTILVVTGTNFDNSSTEGLSGAQISLVRSGETTVQCISEAQTGNTEVSGQCDTSGLTLGLWDVTITNNDGSSGSLSQALEVTDQVVSNVQLLDDWDTSGALYTSQLTISKLTGAESIHPLVVYPLVGSSLNDSNLLSATGLNGMLAEGSGNRWGGMPPSDKIAVQSAQSDDGGVFSDQTTAANNATTGDITLLPATVATDDAFYVGLNYPGRAVTVSVSTGGSGDWTCQWEYSDGSGGWPSVAQISDGTDCFRNSGEKIVSFALPPKDQWAQETVNGSDSYWLRMRITDGGTTVTAPTGTQIWWETGVWYSVTPSIQSGSGRGYSLFLGGQQMGADPTGHQIFTGTSGVMSSDAASLEWGNDYQLVLRVYVDSRGGSDQQLLFKDGAIEVSIPSIGLVQADLTDSGGTQTLSVAGVGSGLQEIVLEATGSGTTRLEVTDIGSDEETVGSITDTANDWRWCLNGSCRFLDLTTISVGSSEVLRYQLQELPSLTVTDESGNGNDGSASFPTGMELGLSSSVGPLEALGVEGTGTDTSPLPSLPDLDLFGEEAGSSLPGFSFLEERIGDSVTPGMIQLLWILGSGVLAVMVGVTVTKAADNLLFGMLGMLLTVVVAVNLGNGVLPWWLAITLVIGIGFTLSVIGQITKPGQA